MSKKATLTNVSSGYSSGATLNANFEALNDQFENTLSLDGSTPNKMGGDLDLDSNDLLNAGEVSAQTLRLGGEKVVSLSSTPSWKGAWVTAQNFVVNDLVKESGSTYICLVSHTSGTFSTDLSNNLWELFASKGSAGAGTGDMLAANNLSDVSDVAASRANLGLGTAATTASTDYATATQGTKADNAIPAPATPASGDVLYHNGSAWVRLPKGTDGEKLTLASGVPTWDSSGLGPDYDSGEQVITISSKVTLAHGLVSKPTNYKLFAVCKVAENGYSIGEEIPLPTPSQNGVTIRNAQISTDATNIYIRTGPTLVTSGNTGDLVTLTPARWRYIVRAWL